MKINGISTIIEHSEKPANKLAILLPGYLDSKDYAHFKHLSTELCNMGYTVACFDPTGTWKSEDKIEQYSTTQYLKDLKSVIDYLIEENQKQFNKMILCGHSMGGQVAMLYASDHPEISTVIGIAPSQDFSKVDSIKKALPKWKEEGFRYSKRDLPADPEKFIEFRVPFSFLEDRSNYNLLDKIKSYRGRLILIAGELDETVTPKTVQETFEAANEPKEYILIPNIDHDYRHDPAKIKTVVDEITKALNK